MTHFQAVLKKKIDAIKFKHGQLKLKIPTYTIGLTDGEGTFFKPICFNVPLNEVTILIKRVHTKLIRESSNLMVIHYPTSKENI